MLCIHFGITGVFTKIHKQIQLHGLLDFPYWAIRFGGLDIYISSKIYVENIMEAFSVNLCAPLLCIVKSEI